MRLFNIQYPTALRKAHAGWVEEALKVEDSRRNENWSESLAVGSRDFVNRVQAAMGVKATYRARRASASSQGRRGVGMEKVRVV
jgi:putative transposase